MGLTNAYSDAQLSKTPIEEEILGGIRSFTAQIKRYYFLHLTRISNLASIFENALFCRSVLLCRKMHFANLGNQDILERRGRWEEYVPLFFVPRTAMLYNIQHADGAGIGIDEICFINVELPIIGQQVKMPDGEVRPCYVTDGNAASSRTRFFSVASDLKNVLHENISKEILLKPPSSRREWRRQRAAEILVPWKIETRFLKSVVVFNRDCKDKARSVLGRNSLINIKEEKDYFFYDL